MRRPSAELSKETDSRKSGDLPVKEGSIPKDHLEKTLEIKEDETSQAAL